MTQKITIISGKSVTEKLAYWFGLSLAGLMFYGGIVSINDCSTNSICERNESSIKALIQARKFDRVRKLLEEYKDLPGGDLRLGDKIILEEMLEQEIQKKNLEDELNNAMTEKNYDLAEKLVAKAKNSGLNVAAYERTLKMTTEEGLHTLISQATGEKEALIQEYLTLYPEGAHKKEIIRYLILEDFKKIYSLLPTNTNLTPQEYSPIFNSIVKTNSTLEKYSSENVSLEGVFSLNDFEQKINELLNKEITTKGVGTGLDRGVLVRTVHHDHSHCWPNYFEIRKEAIPTGLSGKIIGRYGQNHNNGNHVWYLVEFNDAEVNKNAWTTVWSSDSQHWNNGKKNVASYLAEELLAYDETINEIDKNLLRTEIEKMKRLLEHHGGN